MFLLEYRKVVEACTMCLHTTITVTISGYIHPLYKPQERYFLYFYLYFVPQPLTEYTLTRAEEKIDSLNFTE